MSDKNQQSKKKKSEYANKFTSAESIRRGLKAQNPDALIEALNQLRNQITIRPEEGVIVPQDERLLLVEKWLEGSPGAQDVFGLWENTNPRQTNLCAAIVSLLAALLPLLSSHYTYHALGHPIVKGLLSPQWMRRLNTYVGGAHNELTLVTLKLLNAISGYAGGREKKALLEGFQWEIKTLPKLLTLRRKGKVDYNPLSRPDIRTLYILFLLSFLDGPTQVKAAFLEQHRNAFLAVFKGLPQDHYLFIRHTLEIMWTNLWSDPKIKRTTKIGLFNEVTISHLFKIYERTSSNDEDPEHIPADLVHHFLLAIMTRPGIGICFKDRGWYPRDDTEDERGGKIYNKILANVLKTLKVNEDSRQQELARKILEACPELVAGYWPSAQLTLEPRLSTKWIANIAFFGTIISLPVPESTFYLPNTELYDPTPPPLHIILSNILPSDVSPRNIFTKGLLSPSGLVKHCTALSLAKCIAKYASVLKVFENVENALEVKGTEVGPWAKRRREVEKEVRRRVPEFQVILGFSQQKWVSAPKTAVSNTPAPLVAPNPVRTALLQESAQRLLLLYHKHLPEVVAEARFDVGKVLANFDAFMIDDTDEDYDSPQAAKKLHLVQRLHVLCTLKESDQFVWTNKTSTSHTYLYAILKSYTTARAPALKSTLLDLLSHLLSSCILFEETPTESNLWLTSLPSLLRAPNATSPDNANLTDEAESVVTFIDDCIQRCLKTPYKYIEEMRSSLASATSSNFDAETYPSPLTMTVLEQLDAKIKAGILTPSDVLAISSFIRKLVFRLSGQVQSLVFLDIFVARVDQMLSEMRLWQSNHPVMTAAVRMEVKMMYTAIKPMQLVEIPTMISSGLRGQLPSTEPLPSEVRHRRLLAHSIVDRIRFLDQPLSLLDAKRVIVTVQACHAPALQELVQYLFPRSGSLWENHIFVGTDIGETLPIEWLFLNASDEQLLDSDYRRCFIAALFSAKPNLQSCLTLIRQIMHRLDTTDALVARGLLSVLAVLLNEARLVFNEQEMVSLKELLFVDSGALKRFAMTRNVDDRVYMGLQELLQSSFKPLSSADRHILSEVSAHWLALLDQLSHGDINISQSSLWLKYLPPWQLLHLLDQLVSSETISHLIPLIQSILSVIRSAVSQDKDTLHALSERIPHLWRARQQLKTSPELEELILATIDSTLPMGLSGCGFDAELDQSISFSAQMQQASSRWARKSLRLGQNISLSDILDSDTWFPSTPRVIASLAYKEGLDIPMFETWLKSKHSTRRPTKDLVTVIHAALDIHHCVPLANSLNPTAWIPHLRNIVPFIFNHDTSSSSRRKASSSLALALKAFINHQQDLVRLGIEQIDLNHPHQPTPECIRMGTCSLELSAPLLDWALHWLIGHLADNTFLSPQVQQISEEILSLVQVSIPKSHQVETLLGVVVQHHLSDLYAVELANACVAKTVLKPVIVNRYLQNILHHPQFLKLASGANSDSSLRLCIIRFLHTLFELHPTNTCQITQVEPLLQLYGGTLAAPDLLIFSIFQLFEIQRKTSLVPLFNHWSSSKEIACSSALEGLQSLDPTIVFRTTLHHPKWRRLQSKTTTQINNHDRQLYDPVFLLLLLHCVLSQHPPSTPFGWIELFRTNIAGLCIRTLSSKDKAIRSLSLSLLTGLRKSIESLVFQEKEHVTYIFDLLRDLFVSPPSTDYDSNGPPRLPSYTTLILAHALRGVFYPSNFIYPLTARFLLQRPELDPHDVPMLYSMLYSNADNWKKERGWIIRFLADGMISSDDWRVLKRRHGFDLLASLFQSAGSDLGLRRGIFEVLANLTCNQRALMSMIFRSSFLTWLEMQIQQRNGDEQLEWTKVLTNIAFTADHPKLDSVFRGSWRNGIYRCLSMLLNGPNPCTILPIVVTTIFKLDQSSDTPSPNAEECIRLAVQTLRTLETQLSTPVSFSKTTETTSRAPVDVFPGHSIHEPLVDPHSYATWLDCVTLLWRITMRFEQRSSSWDELTSKLLASCYLSEATNDEMEWVRKHVVSLQCVYN